MAIKFQQPVVSVDASVTPSPITTVIDCRGRTFYNITLPVITHPLLFAEALALEDQQREWLKTKPGPEFTRPSGECICEQCGWEYWRHPRHDPFFTEHVLCGDIVVHI